jgi:hypothetical protein
MANIIKIFLAVAILGGAVIYFFQNPPEFTSGISSGERTSIYRNFFAPSQNSAPRETKSISTPYSPQSFGSQPVKDSISDSQIPAGFSREDLSPYFQEVKVSSVSSYSSASGEKSVTIRMNYSVPQGQAINITGWRVKSNRGEIFLPQAVRIYEPNGSNGESDIVVSGSGNISLYRGRSPIGKNFRLNKCTGYLQKTYNFSPSLPLSCPRVERSELINFSGQCQSYILSLSSCALPNLNIYNSFPGTDQGNECRAFLSGITEYACFRDHNNDSNFLSNEWRIWMEFNDNIFDGQHDRILVFDKDGLLVSEKLY